MKQIGCIRWLSLLLAAMTLLTLLSCDGQTDREYRHEEPDCYYSARNVDADELLLQSCPAYVRNSYETVEEFESMSRGTLRSERFTLLSDGSFGKVSAYGQQKMQNRDGEVSYAPGYSYLIEYDPQTEALHYTSLFREVQQENGKTAVEKISYNAKEFPGRMADGTIVLLENFPEYDAEGNRILKIKDVEYPHNFVYLTTYTEAGAITSSTLLYDIDPRIGSAEISSVYKLLLIDGTLYLAIDTANAEYYSMPSFIAAIDIETMTLKGYWDMNSCCADIAAGLVDFSDFQFSMSGEPYIIFLRNDNLKTELCSLETFLYPPNGEEPERIVLRNGMNGSIVAFSDTTAYYSNDFGLFREPIDAGEDDPAEMLLYWLDIDLSGTTNPYGNGYGRIYMSSEDRIFMTYTDNYTFIPYFIYIERSDTPVQSDKTVLTVAYDGAMSYSSRAYALDNFLNLASNFNRTNSEYRIRLISYTGSGSSSANDLLKLDLVSGLVPDMILFGGSITPEPFVRMEEFVDLYSLMDADDTYTREAFLPCVLKPFETAKGQLPYLPVNFTLRTTLGLSSATGGKTAWTLDDFENALNNLGENQYLIKLNGSDNPQMALLEAFLPAVVNQYIDYEHKKTDFGGDFKRLLALCKDAPVMAVDGYPEPSAYRDGDVLMMDCEIKTIDAYIYDRLALAAEQPISAIGAPRSDGAAYGTAVLADMQLSILKACEHPDAAWEFIKYYLAGGVDQWETFRDRPHLLYSTNGFVPTVACMEKMFEVLREISFFYRFDPVELPDGGDGVSVYKWVFYGPEHEDYKIIYPKLRKYYAENEGLTDTFFTESDEALFRSLFESCTAVWSRDDAVLDILYEEASAYFAGAKSLDDTIRLMENRVKTRINE